MEIRIEQFFPFNVNWGDRESFHLRMDEQEFSKAMGEEISLLQQTLGVQLPTPREGSTEAFSDCLEQMMVCRTRQQVGITS